MKRAVGAMLVAALVISACATAEEQARQRCAGAPDMAACLRADQEARRAAEDRMMEERQMNGGMGMDY